MSGLNIILRSPQTVFTFSDICLLFGETDKKTVISKVNYYIKKGQLIRLRKGIYAKDDNYNPLELASKIYVPSYISFETVLTEAGINFQFYSETKLASYLNRVIFVGKNTYTFTKIKDSILVNQAGVENINGITIATKERAFLDTLYSRNDYYFDNLDLIDWQKVFEILPIYNNKRMGKNVNKLYAKHHKT